MEYMGYILKILGDFLLDVGENAFAFGAIAAVLSLIEVSKIKINPWTALRNFFSKIFKSAVEKSIKDVLPKLEELERTQNEIRAALDEHIRLGEIRTADEYRRNILRFNNELLRDKPHTKEDFTEILGVIDEYERYCHENPGYQNNMAVHAITNISGAYDERLKKHDFLT